MNQSNFVISYVNGTHMYGTNKTEARNGVKNWELIGPKLILPSYLDGKEITEVGQFAFCRCYYLKELFIDEGIKVLNDHAFGYCPNLTSIIIPPSVECIMYCSLHAYNESCETYTSVGTMKVTFAGDSMIKYIDHYSITRKEHVVIIFNGKTSPIYGNDPFYRRVIKSIKVYSTFTHSFCGVRSKIMHSQRCNKQRFITRTIFIIVIIYVRTT